MEQYQKIIGNYIRLLWGGRWLIAVCAVLAFAIATTVASRMPDVFEAEAVLMPDYARMNSGVVSSPADASVADVLRSAKNRMLTWNMLAQMIEALDPYPELRQEYGEMAKEMAVKKLRKELDVVVNNTSQAIEVRYRHSGHVDSARIAAGLVNHLTDAFVTEQRMAVLSSGRQLSDFIAEQNAQRLTALQEAEMHLRDFEEAHFGELPQDRNDNLKRKDTLKREIQTLRNQQERNQEEIERLEVESLQTRQLLKRAEEETENTRLEFLHTKLTELETQYEQDRIQFTDESDHLRDLRLQIEHVKANIAELEASTSETPENLTASWYRLTLDANLGKQQRLSKDNERIGTQIQEAQNDIALAEQRYEKAGMLATDYARLQREVQKAQSVYQSLRQKAETLELGTQFGQEYLKAPLNIEQEAIVPIKPVGPMRMLISVAGLIGGLALGIGLTLARLVLSSKIRATEELRRLMPGAVVVTIPQISVAGIRVGRASLALVACAVLLALFAASCGVLAIREGWLFDQSLIRPLLEFKLPRVF